MPGASLEILGDTDALTYENWTETLNVNVVAQATQLGDAPAIEDLIGAIKVMLDAYIADYLKEEVAAEVEEDEEVAMLKALIEDERNRHGIKPSSPDT